MRTALAIALLTVAAPTSAAVRPQMTVELIASTLAPRAGATVLVGFRMVPKSGWHGYWSNAGGSGIAPTVTWSAPPGVKFGPLLHPAPTLFRSLGVVSYVHSGEHVLVSRMTLPAGTAVGTPIPVKANLSFAVCSDRLCVPGHGTFSLAMIAGSGAPSEDVAALSRALSRVPARLVGGSYWSQDGALTIFVPGGARLRPSATRFFPDDNGFFDAFAADASEGSPIRITAPLSGSPPMRITGVVSDGASSYRLSLTRSAPEPQAEAVAPRGATSRKAAIAEAAVTEVPPSSQARSSPQERSAPSRSHVPLLPVIGGSVLAGLALTLLLLRRRPRP